MKTNFVPKVDRISIKILVMGILIVVMLIPIGMVSLLIMERESNQRTVIEEISNKWGEKQYITGPILVLPYENGKDNTTQKTMINYAYFLPDSYDVDGEINPEERKRTIFKTLVYQSTMNIKGKFAQPDYEILNLKEEQIKWQDAFFIIGITDLKGIKNKIEFNVNGKAYAVQPGIKNNNVINSGLTVNMPIDSTMQEFEFSFDLALNGSELLYFIPVGKENRIHLSSPWKTISFDGDFLPSERTINDEGFDAKWDVFDYNRNYVQSWTGNNEILRSSVLGVNLKFEVDKYQMTMRSVKYAIIFIVLTFVVFFLVEILSQKRIHPVQYLLVSCALILFYTLLLAISEHLDFALAYLISAFATTMLITLYSKTMFRKTKQTAMMGGFLIALYTYLYIILIQENFALLFGAVGLFVALAIVMFVLRKIRWYDDEKKDIEEKESFSPTGKIENDNKQF